MFRPVIILSTIYAIGITFPVVEAIEAREYKTSGNKGVVTNPSFSELKLSQLAKLSLVRQFAVSKPVVHVAPKRGVFVSLSPRAFRPKTFIRLVPKPYGPKTIVHSGAEHSVPKSVGTSRAFSTRPIGPSISTSITASASKPLTSIPKAVPQVLYVIRQRKHLSDTAPYPSAHSPTTTTSPGFPH